MSLKTIKVNPLISTKIDIIVNQPYSLNERKRKNLLERHNFDNKFKYDYISLLGLDFLANKDLQLELNKSICDYVYHEVYNRLILEIYQWRTHDG